MPRANLESKLDPSDIGNPMKEDIAATMVVGEGLQRLKEVDGQAYNAIMDMYEGEIRGLFGMILTDNISDEMVIETRRHMMSLSKLVSLIDQRENLYLSPEWQESMMADRDLDKQKLEVALEMRREAVNPSRSRGRGMP